MMGCKWGEDIIAGKSRQGCFTPSLSCVWIVNKHLLSTYYVKSSKGIMVKNKVGVLPF